MRLKFTVDSESKEYVEEILDCLCSNFGKSKDEALAIVNHYWGGKEIVGDDLIYHRLPEEWADYFISDNEWNN